MIKIINDDCRNIIKNIKEEFIIVSDPPFNIGYHYNYYKDNLKKEEYNKLLIEVFSEYKSVIIHYPEKLYEISHLIKKIPVKVVSWVYNSNTPKQHRDIAFFDIKPDFKQVIQPYKNLNDKRIKERIKRGILGGKLYDWWFVNQVKNVSKEKTKHPAQMPLEIMENIIGILPKESIILDPFMGSGTTGVAVINMNKKQNANRKFIGIEIDKYYYDIAKERINEALLDEK